MTEAQAIEAITQRWITAWPALQPLVPYTFENEAYLAVDTWVRVTLVHAAREQATMGSTGNRRFEARGAILVQLFGAVDVGRRPLAQLADSVRSVFEGQRIGTEITTYGGSTRELPTDGRWARSSVSIPVWYDEQR
jgi:hypothetical protein